MTARDTVIAAIKARVPLQIRKRTDRGTRVVHPHVLYRAGPGQGANLSAWQVSNSGKPSDRPDWRTFNIEDIAEASQMEGQFSIRGDFRRSSPMYGHGIIAAVER